MKIIVDKNSKEDFEKLKKIYIILGMEIKVIEERAKELNLKLKDEATLKQEIKAEAEKPVIPLTSEEVKDGSGK